MSNFKLNGSECLGIEFGSTRIKAILIDDEFNVLATGSYDWENKLVDGYWTYSIDDIWHGLQSAYKSLNDECENKFSSKITSLSAIGFSAMMHGYLAFDKDDNLLVPFRTWRNTTTAQAARELTRVFNFNIPQRWSIAHLYQAILNNEEHVKDISYITTLAGYVHYKLSGKKALGIGDASGMFPIDSDIMHITTVDLGDGVPTQIVCGAPNVAAGQHVVVATIGTVLYASISSAALFTPAKAASMTASGEPTNVTTVRLVASPGSTSSSLTPPEDSMADVI